MKKSKILISNNMSHLENNHRNLDFATFAQHSNEAQEITDASQLLDRRGLRVLTQEETDTIASDFARELMNGLTPEYHSNLPMVNTRIPVATFSDLTPDEEALVLVLGGTHVRAAVVSVDKSRKPYIKRDGIAGKQYYQEATIQQRAFSSPNEFYDAMLEPINPFIAEQQPQAVGIIYAFGGSAVEGTYGVDIQPFATMGKKFAVPGIHEKPVGEIVFQRPALSSLKGTVRRAVMNDMAPVCIAGEAKVGSIIATGFNIGLAINGVYDVTEVGGHFKEMPTHYYADLIDSQSNNPGHAVLEKQLSGGYLGLTLTHALADLWENGHIPIQISDELGSEVVTDIVNGQSLLLQGQDEKTKQIILGTAASIGHRAAQGMGTLIGSAIRTFPHEFPEKDIRVPIEGPLFWSMRGFEQIAKNYAAFYADKDVTFLQIPLADIVGAGIAALLGKQGKTTWRMNYR